MRLDLRELAARESEQVEWKQQVADPDDVVRTIVAFANDLGNLGGGYVVCGAAEERDEHGFQGLRADGLTSSRAKEVEGRVLAACLAKVSPPLVPLVEELPAATVDRRLLVFVIAATGHAHAVRTGEDSGKYLVRVGRTTREARNGLLLELLGRKGARVPWDRRPATAATVADLDLVAMRDLLVRLRLWRDDSAVDDWLDPDRAMSPLVPPLCVREPLTAVLRPRYFALLLCGRHFQRWVPEAHVILSVYPGTDRAADRSERHEIIGTLLQQYAQIMALLTPEAHQLIDKTQVSPHADKYPLRALQEAVVNALVHRDYEQYHPVRITVFADRIEVASPGGLPSAVKHDRLLQGRASPVWRNQALAWVANKLELAQGEGQGVATIIWEMQQAGCPPPLFELGDERVTCVLPAHPRAAPSG